MKRTNDRAKAIPEEPSKPVPRWPIFKERRTWIGLAAIFFVSFALYVATCARTVTGEDSGELITAAYTMGVPHPPGYPLWTLLAKGFTFLPLGEIAFRVALLSAFLGALTIAATAALVLYLSMSWPSAVLAGLGFGLLRDQWSQAVIAEVYTLNSFLIATAALLLFLFGETKSFRVLRWFAFLVGLSLANHHTALAFSAPAFFYLLFVARKLLFRWKEMGLATLAFLAGLLPYAYLPIAASQRPYINWGDPSTLEGFTRHVLRRQYTDNAVIPERSFERFSAQVSALWSHILGQGALPLFLLGGIASFWLLRRRFGIGFVLVSTALMSTLVLLLYTNNEYDFENAYAMRLFFVPGYFAMVVMAGIFFGRILEFIPRKVRAVSGSAFAAALIALPLTTNFEAADYSNYKIVDDYGRRLLASVEEKAVLFPSSDHNGFPILYLHHVLGVRPDITIADKYGYIDPEFYKGTKFDQGPDDRFRVSRLHRAGIEGFVITELARPAYFSHKQGLPCAEGYVCASEGLWYRAVKRDPDDAPAKYGDLKAWKRIRDASQGREEDSPHDYTARMILGDLHFANARHFFAFDQEEKGKEAGALAISETPLVKETHNNIGSLLAESGHIEDAWPRFKEALRLDPTYHVARRNLAVSLRAKGHDSEAMLHFEYVLTLDSDDPVAHRGLGEIARKEEQWHIAAYHLEKIGRLEGNPKDLRDAGLIALFEHKDEDKAKGLLRASLRIDPRQEDIAELERKIPEPKAEDRRGSEQEGEEDHSKHNCREKGCEAKKIIANATKPKALGAPPSADPFSALIPEGDSKRLGLNGGQGWANPTVQRPSSPLQGGLLSTQRQGHVP